MKVMSLFAGIGGFDLAAQHMGWSTAVQVELDDWCRRVLAKNFPDAKQYANIRDFDATPYHGAIDLICGGFPCQPFSQTGKRRGNQDDRALWPEMLRVIREVAPRWVVGENVYGLLTQDDGLVFESCLVDLETEGYTVWTYLLPACGVNAPHRRDRIWIVAYAHSQSGRQRATYRNVHPAQQGIEGQTRYDAGYVPPPKFSEPYGFQMRESPLCAGNDGLPPGLDRTRTIAAAGNAVVWQLVYQIFQAIQQVDDQI